MHEWTDRFFLLSVHADIYVRGGEDKMEAVAGRQKPIESKHIFIIKVEREREIGSCRN